MKIFGILLLCLGLVLTITIIFSWIGIPLMFVGAIVIWAGRSPTVITNVIHNSPSEKSDSQK